MQHLSELFTPTQIFVSIVFVALIGAALIINLGKPEDAEDKHSKNKDAA
jgi:hypothetical protein